MDVSLAWEPHPLSGDITTLTNERAINNSVQNIVMSLPGEFLFRNDVGSNTKAYLFELVDESTAGLITLEVRRAISYNEPRVKVISVITNVLLDSNAFECLISYQIIGYDNVFEVSYILSPTR